MKSPTDKLSDPGGVRRLHARWVFTTDLIIQSGTHFGGGDGDAADMVLVRDIRSGGPLLPGTSLAGALRSHLGDILGGYRSKEDTCVTDLFGGGHGSDLGAQSPLIVFDSFGVLPAEHPVEIRDGVAINPQTGTAETHKKFDLEVLPAGTRFPLRLELLIEETTKESGLVGLLITSLSGLATGDLSLGARRSRGLGMTQAEEWRAVRFDLASAKGWHQWLVSDPEHPISPNATSARDPVSACRSAHPALNFDSVTDQRRRVVAIAELSVRGGVLVRSAPYEPDAPDAVHLRSGGRSVLSGTSVAGTLRNRALRIAGIVHDTPGNAENWVSRMFGPRLNDATRGSSDSFIGSRLRISEAVIENGTRAQPSRIQIDRFTQGVVPGALFDEEPNYEGRVSVRLELRSPQPGETGLFLLILKDLLTGDLPVGGAASVGRGVLYGTAHIVFADGYETRLHLAEALDPDTTERLNAAIRQFHETCVMGEEA